MIRARALFGMLACALCACGGDTPELMLAQPDFPAFQAEVYPVLLRDCGFSTCHGSSERYLQVYGPGRRRLDPLTPLLDPPTDVEILHSYYRALSMIDAGAHDQSLLLRKPLSLAVGGAGHEGVDSWMRDVYTSKQEPNYIVLERWVIGVVPPGVGGLP